MVSWKWAHLHFWTFFELCTLFLSNFQIPKVEPQGVVQVLLNFLSISKFYKIVAYKKCLFYGHLIKCVLQKNRVLIFLKLTTYVKRIWALPRMLIWTFYVCRSPQFFDVVMSVFLSLLFCFYWFSRYVLISQDSESFFAVGAIAHASARMP